MSAGPGRVQRQVLAALLSAPEHRLTRRGLEEKLAPRGIRPANVLRALRSLEASHIIHFNDLASKEQSTVALLGPSRRFSDDEVLELIRAAT
jgi:Fe2+ or Zn2+ uptake regulation protein